MFLLHAQRLIDRLYGCVLLHDYDYTIAGSTYQLKWADDLKEQLAIIFIATLIFIIHVVLNRIYST